MKLLVVLVVFLTSLSAIGQDHPKAELVDEFGEQCSEEVMARIDNFLIRINDSQTNGGVVIFYGRKDMDGRSRKLAGWIENRPTRPGINLPKLKVIRGADRSEQLIQFWLVASGAEEPKPDQPFQPNSYTETTLFDRAPIGFQRWQGFLDIYNDGFYDLGCDFSPNRGVFAKILKENKNLNAFLIAYADSKKPRQGRKLASFALNDLANNYAVPRRRIRAIYGGTRKAAEIELWIVPKGQKTPLPRPGLPPIRNY